MSHLVHRKEKNCLNCGTTVIGPYCHVCGQENLEPKESIWHLVVHFFNDVTHFDGKFFSTLKDILFRPGFLSKEYMKGRRASYLNPIRMYLFTSFIFFLVFFWLYHIPEKEFRNTSVTIQNKTIEQIDSLPQAEFKNFTKLLNNGQSMSRKEFGKYADSVKNHVDIHFFDSEKKEINFKSRKEYDSLLALKKIKDGWFRRQMTYKEIEIKNEYQGSGGKFLSDFINSLMHHFPQILFFSLPFVALLLKLLYIRQKKFYYVSNAIFTLHLYIFVFIVLLFEIGINQLHRFTGWPWLNIINTILAFIIFFYLYKAMRNFYEQRRFKTIIKYALFLLSFFFLIIFLFVIFAFISIFQV